MTAVLLSVLLQSQLGPPGLRDDLVAAARSQVGVTVRYDGSYRRLRYPGGDVAVIGGVCSDVVVRAYRRVGIDLQVLVHDDMTRNWPDYPHLWGLRGPDSNIDHRRVPNLATFFRRHGTTLSTGNDPSLYGAGDVVTWRLPGGLPHIGIVSSEHSGTRPLVVHNIGDGAREEDVLFAWAITGHFRYPPAAAASSEGRRVGSRAREAPGK